MGDPGGLPSMGSHRVGHDWSDLAAAAAAAGLYSKEIMIDVSKVATKLFTAVLFTIAKMKLM